ncbi:MAG: cache domain-containing protein [Gammaproteobacteria bacterium]|nr:cache domain-containing protein [Gammaproteobacteria bacterium]
MQKPTRPSKPKRKGTIEVTCRFFFSVALLFALLATTQACQTSTAQDDVTKDQVEVALNTLIAKFRTERPVDAKAYAGHLKSYLEANPTFYGAAAAILDENRNVIACPYVYRASGGFQTLDLATPDYDIENQAWFSEPLSREKGNWTAPYFDEGGGEIWMITYSVPARDAQGIFAIVTTDLSLNTPSN